MRVTDDGYRPDSGRRGGRYVLEDREYAWARRGRRTMQKERPRC